MHDPGIAFLDCAPEAVAAIRNGHASFVHVALAHAYGRGDEHGLGGASPEDREVLRSNFAGLIERFEDEHGTIARSYFARSAFAAAVLTTRDEISIAIGRDLPVDGGALVELLLRCQHLAYAAWHRTAKYDRRLCQNMIFSVVEELLRRLDRKAARTSTNGNTPSPREDLESLREQLEDAEEFMLRCATRRAQISYLKGMLAGTGFVGALLGFTLTVVAVLGALVPVADDLLVVGTAGALGAVVSVLARTTSGTFRINLPTLSYEMRRTDLWTIGGLRPLIGLIFALAAYVFVVSALVPMQARDPNAEIFLYAAVGFLAGFSERFAQDMFVRSGQGLAAAMGDTPTSGPSAGLAPASGTARHPASRRRRERRAG
jgi:hypothetical protein